MPKIAIFDTGAGFLQWIGEADSKEAALRAMCDEVGDWHDVDQNDADDDVRLYFVTEDQAKALRAWSDAGSVSGDFPDLKDEGTIYSIGEVKAMLAGND